MRSAKFIYVVKKKCVLNLARFESGTKVIAHAIAESSVFSIASGAFPEALEGKTLRAFEILQKRAAG